MTASAKQSQIGPSLENRLRRYERLRSRADIKAVFTQGRRVSCPGMGLFRRDTGLRHNRVLFTTRRGFGGAVARNRARRLGREVYRVLKADVVSGFDLAFVFYPGSFESRDRSRQLAGLLSQAGLLRTREIEKTAPVT